MYPRILFDDDNENDNEVIGMQRWPNIAYVQRWPAILNFTMPFSESISPLVFYQYQIYYIMYSRIEMTGRICGMG